MHKAGNVRFLNAQSAGLALAEDIKFFASLDAHEALYGFLHDFTRTAPLCARDILDLIHEGIGKSWDWRLAGSHTIILLLFVWANLHYSFKRQ